MGGVEGRIVVVGGSNLDVVGHPYDTLRSRDSNPGYIRRSAGGVGRNIAENLARLGIDTALVTAFGSGADADLVAEDCTRAGIDISGSLHVQLPGATYLAILDPGGDMALALSDMRPLERLTASALEERRELLDGASVVVADANLPVEALEWLATEVAAPIVFDPVSTTKAVKAAMIVGELSAIKCNVAEATALLGVPDGNSAEAASLATALLEAGVEAAYVTAGSWGTWYATTTERGQVEAPHAAMVNTTGAGDAFTAGVAAAMLGGATPPHAAALGTRLASITLASEHTVSEQVTPEILEEELNVWRS